MLRLLLILNLLLSCCMTAEAAEIGRLAMPDVVRVNSITPDRVAQGQSVTLLLQGSGLHAGLQVDLGTGVDSGALSMVNDTSARATLRVRPDAAPGRRTLTLINGRVRLPQRPGVTIQAAAVHSESATVAAPSPGMDESPQGMALSTRTETATTPASVPLRLLQVTPNRLQQGRPYTLNFSGQGFAAGMSIDFGDGIRLRGPVQVQSAGAAIARVEVATDAAPGFRTLTLSLAGSPTTTAIAAPPAAGQQSQTARAIEIVGRVTALPNPAIEGTRAAPAQGGGFAPPSVGGGFAPPVMPASPSAPLPAAVPKITRIKPDHLTTGRIYSLTLEGEHLNGTLHLDFGPGISLVGRPLASGERRLNLTVKLDPKADSGTRKLQLAQKFGAPKVEQPAEFTISPAPVVKQSKPQRVTPKLPVLDTTRVLKARIELQGPNWRTQVASQAPIKDPVTGKPLGQPVPVYEVDLPLLNDDLLFTWKESNPGTSEWFEIRFYTKNKLIAKRRIDPITMKLVGKSVPVLPTWFRPDGKLVSELLQQVAPPPQASAQPSQTGPSGQVSVTQDQPSLSQQPTAVAGALISPSDPALALANAKLLWEVAGYRRYHKSGVVKSALAQLPARLAAFSQADPKTLTDAQPATQLQGFTETEVAISERWPLKRPAAPTGLGCGSETGSLTLVNLDQTGKQQGGALTVEAGDGHVGDRFRISGSFKLDVSPYASHPQTQQSSFNPPFGGSPQVFATSWHFDNLFVDWGDGTLTPFSMTQLGDAGSFNSGDTLSLGEKGQQHSYSGTGSYTVRLYQLASSDVQAGGQHVAVQAVDPSQNLYAKVALTTPGGNTGQQQIKWSKSVADRAYMLFCRNIQIEPRSDPASHGPLQLVDIAIDGFAGQQQPQPGATDKSKSGAQRKAKSNNPTLQTGANPSGNLSRAKPQVSTLVDTLPSVSSCDAGLTAEADLGYIGQGRARLHWRLDGLEFGQNELHLGPSKPRSQQDLAKLAGKASWFDLSPVAPPIVDHAANLPSPAIEPGDVGKHRLTVEAEVIPEAKSNALYGLLAAAFGANGMQADPALAKSLAGQFKHAPKIGVLSPSKVAVAGIPAVSYLNQPLLALAGEPEPIRLAALTLEPAGTLTLSDATLSLAAKLASEKGPPNFVASAPFGFKVAGADKAQACSFDFPVPGGVFKVAGLQTPDGAPKVTHDNGLYQGTGTLLIKLQNGGGAVKQWPVPISFQKWQLKTDGVTVAAGGFTIDQTGLSDLLLPGIKASIAKLSGQAGVGVDAWLNARLAHPELVETATGNAPAWNQVKGALSPDGDWYAGDLPMAETRLYLGGFRLDPDKVALDLSARQGSANSACAGGAETQFIGVGLGDNAKLTAYDFSLKGTPTAQVSGWGIDAGGVCGKADLGPFKAALGKGELAWDGIGVTASGGKLNAKYHNLRVKVPWIEAELKGQGDPVFTAGQGNGTITLALKGQAAPVKNGPITLEATNLALKQLPNVGWAVSADTRFDFAGSDKLFAKDVWLDGLLFGLDGRAYLPNGPQSGTLTQTSGFIAQGPVTLKSVQISAPDTGPQRLQFDFLADLQISKTLQAANMPVSYRISENSGSYQGSGPVLGSVPVTYAFPKTDTVTKGVIHPEYVGDGPGSTASAEPPPPLSWIATADALNKKVIYRGSTEMDFLKSVPLPVNGQFELGYYGNDDYWAAVVDYQIPPPGLTVVPNLLNLYSLGGGLGYNVEPGSLSSNLASVTPKITGNNVYGAHLTAGSAFDGGFAYTLKGYFNIDPAHPALQMDFGLWLLSNSHVGTPPITGALTYGSGIFHTTMGGEQKILGDFARVYANPGTLVAHLEDNGDWYLFAGTADNPVQGEMIKLINGGVWLNLGRDEGLRVGAKVDAKLPDITCEKGDTCAYVSGKLTADATVTPQPHANADSTVGLSAKGCLGGCLSLGVNADMHLAGPSPELGFGFGLNGCPVGKLRVDLEVLPVVDPGVTAGLCSPYEIGEAVVEGAEALLQGVGSATEGVYNAGKDLVCKIFC